MFRVFAFAVSIWFATPEVVTDLNSIFVLSWIFFINGKIEREKGYMVQEVERLFLFKV